MAESFSPRRRARLLTKAIRLIEAGTNVKEVARIVGVDRTTLYRWGESDPRFVAVRKAEDFAHMDEARSMAAAAAPEVVEVLVRIVRESPDERSRVAASKALETFLPQRHGATDDAPLQLEVRLAPRAIEATVEPQPAALEAGEDDIDA